MKLSMSRLTRPMSSAGPSRRRPRRSRAVVAAAAGATFMALAGAQLVAPPTADAAAVSGAGTGFVIPFSGPLRYENLAPREARNAAEINQPLGQRAADEIARKAGLRKEDAFTEEQYQTFIAGGGVGGDPAKAKLVTDSVAILTNTIGRPLISQVDGVPTPSVLASYGVFVNPSGMLESVANADAATRQVNSVIAPGPNGYMGQWMRDNQATKSLIQLYRSIYPSEAAYGFVAQQSSEPAELITNTKGRTSVEVGMSMGPALWLTNFVLIYTLNPALTAYMPAYWAPIPGTVAQAILASPTGQVEYSEYRSAFPS